MLHKSSPPNIDMLVQETWARHRHYRVINVSLILIFAVTGLMAIGVGAIGVLLLGCTMGYAGYRTLQLERKWTHSAVDLIEADDVRTIGPLLEIVFVVRSRERGIIVNALIRLLLRLQGGDAGLLTEADRVRLRRLVWYPFPEENQADYPLSRAILKAYEHVGDGLDFSAVERAAAGFGLNGVVDRSVREAAQVCLPIMKGRLQEVREARILLRAASSAQSSPQTLLRPVHLAVDGKPTELLRAASRTDEEL